MRILRKVLGRKTDLTGRARSAVLRQISVGNSLHRIVDLCAKEVAVARVGPGLVPAISSESLSSSKYNLN